LGFADSFAAVDYMLDRGKIPTSQIKALRSLDQLRGAMGGEENKDVWKRKALFEGPRWAAIRVRAAEVLALLPDEQR